MRSPWTWPWASPCVHRGTACSPTRAVCATTSSIRRASRRSTDTARASDAGYGDLPAGPSGRPARPASGAAPTEDGEAAVPLPNLRVLRRAEEHARVAHHQETSPGEWKPGHEGVATALSAPASHSTGSHSQPLRYCAVAARSVPQCCKPNTSAGGSRRRGRTRPRSPGALSRLATSTLPWRRSRSWWYSRSRCRRRLQLPRHA